MSSTETRNRERDAQPAEGGIVWSDQQKAFFEWFRAGDGHLVGQARAGTGKTTTIMEAIRHAPERRIMLCAFNKSIALELGDRLAKMGLDDAEAATLHSIGFRALKTMWKKLKPVFGGKRSWGLAEAAAPDAPDQILSSIAKLMTLGRECAPFAESWQPLRELALDHDLEPDREWEEAGWDLRAVCRAAYSAMRMAKKKPAGGEIDFSDMLYLPLVHKLFRPTYDLVVLDEAQDMNPAQLEIAQRICAGRFVGIGDDCQAIYGFRGADSQALSRIKDRFEACELGLKTTYRCATAIVEVAQEWVPDFEAGDSNPRGQVLEILEGDVIETARPGDAILSRVNAPLIGMCLRFLRSGKPAMIKGKDVASTLRTMIRELATGKAKDSMPAFLERIQRWETRELARAEKLDDRRRDARVALVTDKADCLLILSEGAASVSELYARIDRIFKEVARGRCVTLSSVHKAKGLEWDTVYVLRGTLRETTDEERNICYVAVTRAKSTLVWVVSDPSDAE